MTEATQTSKALTHNFVTVPRKSPDGPANLVGLTRVDLREVLIENGTPKKQANMRVSQIWQWIYEKGVRDFDQMTNLAKPYRENLKKSFQISVPEIITKNVSEDGVLQKDYAEYNNYFEPYKVDVFGKVSQDLIDYLKPYNLPIFYYPNIVSFSKGYESKWEELK